MNAFLGGSLPTVAVRLLVVSFVVGMLLAMFGFDPETIYGRFIELARHIVDFGLTDLRQFGRILLTGAMVVVPIWFILRLMDTRRALSFLLRSRHLNADQSQEARQILRDLDSLDSHTAFLFDKINFLMDATVGFININQNKVIKIFSVASVAMLPPTLIASIYGMNFKAMPELEWRLGYPFALVLMVLSVMAPFWYFRKKGWLE